MLASQVPGVDAQPSPAEGKGSSAPRPTEGQQDGMMKGANAALAGQPDQAAKDAVNEKRGAPTGEVAASDLPPTPDDHLIPASTVFLVSVTTNVLLAHLSFCILAVLILLPNLVGQIASANFIMSFQYKQGWDPCAAGSCCNRCTGLPADD